MTIARIGWDTDRTDKVTGKTGTNTLLNKFIAIQADIEAGVDVSNGTWQGACRALATYMEKDTTAKEFLDGNSGKYIGPLIAALGGDPSTIPPLPFALAPISNKAMNTGDVKTYKVSVPREVSVASYLWEEVLDTGAVVVLTNSTTQTVTVTAHGTNAGTANLKCTVTATDGGTAEVLFDVTVVAP